jgi:hypothetical protein
MSEREEEKRRKTEADRHMGAALLSDPNSPLSVFSFVWLLLLFCWLDLVFFQYGALYFFPSFSSEDGIGIYDMH